MLAVHTKEGGGGGVRHKVCTSGDQEGQTNATSHFPARGSNPGSSDLNSDSLTTELRLPSVLSGKKVAIISYFLAV